MKGDASLSAAVDLGSNAFRMMIGQRALRNQRLVIEKVNALREPVRLTEGLQDNAFDSRALERGWEALGRFGKRLRGFEEVRVRAVATSAVRQASNASTFLVGAEVRLGFPIDVISGQEEARLVYAGIAHTMPCDSTIRLVVDIGGGSTELIIGCGSQAIFTESIAVGSGTFGKRFFPNGRVESRALQAACMQFARVVRYVRQHGWHAAVGSSGTARMLARTLKTNGLNDGGRGGITYAGLLRLSLLLLEVGQVKRLKLEGLQPHRLGMLPGGLVVMLAAFKVFGIEEMVSSEPGLRLGLLHGLMHDGTPRR